MTGRLKGRGTLAAPPYTLYEARPKSETNLLGRQRARESERRRKKKREKDPLKRILTFFFFFFILLLPSLERIYIGPKPNLAILSVKILFFFSLSKKLLLRTPFTTGSILQMSFWLPKYIPQTSCSPSL